MSTALKVILSLGIILLVGSGSCIACAITLNNDFVSQEKGIKAQFTQNKNNYDNMFKKFKEAAQVPEMYKNDLKEVYDSAIQKRYGGDGSQAMFQWIKEHNPNFSDKLYTNLQQMIESGRDSFEKNQKMLIDKKMVYETALEQFPNSMLAGFLGFPKDNMNQYKIVTSDRTEDVFEKGEDTEIKLR